MIEIIFKIKGGGGVPSPQSNCLAHYFAQRVQERKEKKNKTR